jgi:hypothetical protein
MPPQVAYRLIKDDLTLDGTPTLNLASFVTTYMVSACLVLSSTSGRRGDRQWLYTCFMRRGRIVPRSEPIQSTMSSTLHAGDLAVQNEPRLPLC